MVFKIQTKLYNEPTYRIYDNQNLTGVNVYISSTTTLKELHDLKNNQQ